MTAAPRVPAAPPPLLAVRGISKSFPGVQALRGVDFTLRPGEIHALMGQNGAGKSTLIKVIAGAVRPDGGEIVLGGAPLHAETPAQAQRAGIAAVHQEPHLVPDLSVAENIFLGREPRGRLGLIDWRSMRAAAAEALRPVGLPLDARCRLGSFPIAVQQLVAIARAVQRSSRVLILDEPTSCLDERETRRLFDVMRRLRERGLGLIFITHFLGQVYEVADRITVLRNGRVVGEWPTADLPRPALVTHMIGREPDAGPGATVRGATVCGAAAGRAGTPAAPALETRGLWRRRAIAPCDVRLRGGEIVGLAGLLGSGRTELARLLFGLDRATGGTILRRGRPVRLRSPRRAVRLGLGMLPEDRRTEGLAGHLSLRENVLLALQARRGWLRPLSRRRQREIAGRFIDSLGIDTPDAEKPVRLLSGGNQQKALLARWLATEPDVLILDEPARGIDVGARRQVEGIVEGLGRRGMAILLIDSELDELLRQSDRVIVLRVRRRVAELSGADLREQALMRAIAGG